jgi:hypothetical protein
LLTDRQSRLQRDPAHPAVEEFAGHDVSGDGIVVVMLRLGSN